MFQKPRLLAESELNTIRGKALVGRATVEEVLSVFGHLDILEMELEEYKSEALDNAFEEDLNS